MSSRIPITVFRPHSFCTFNCCKFILNEEKKMHFLSTKLQLITYKDKVKQDLENYTNEISVFRPSTDPLGFLCVHHCGKKLKHSHSNVNFYCSKMCKK